MDIQKIERKITRKVRHKLKQILDGYEIYNSYIDGCDRHGLIYFYDCNNGFNGESWEITEECNKQIINMKQRILGIGILYSGIRYYINSDIYFKDYYDNDLVKIISKKEHNLYLEIKENIINIINKLKEIINFKKNNNIDINNIDSMNLYYNANKLLDYVPLYNYYEFIKYIKTTKTNFKSKRIVIQILNSNDFKEERKILGLGLEFIN